MVRCKKRAEFMNRAAQGQRAFGQANAALGRKLDMAARMRCESGSVIDDCAATVSDVNAI